MAPLSGAAASRASHKVSELPGGKPQVFGVLVRLCRFSNLCRFVELVHGRWASGPAEQTGGSGDEVFAVVEVAKVWIVLCQRRDRLDRVGLTFDFVIHFPGGNFGHDIADEYFQPPGSFGSLGRRQESGDADKSIRIEVVLDSGPIEAFGHKFKPPGCARARTGADPNISTAARAASSRFF